MYKLVGHGAMHHDDNSTRNHILVMINYTINAVMTYNWMKFPFKWNLRATIYMYIFWMSCQIERGAEITCAQCTCFWIRARKRPQLRSWTTSTSLSTVNISASLNIIAHQIRFHFTLLLFASVMNWLHYIVIIMIVTIYVPPMHGAVVHYVKQRFFPFRCCSPSQTRTRQFDRSQSNAICMGIEWIQIVDVSVGNGTQFIIE